MKSWWMCAAVFTLLTVGAFAASDPTPAKLDEIFADLDKTNSPGCSLGVVRDGEFVYRKSYGEGSLELNVPLSSQSVFYMGSVSKQFTAASVVLAAEQGFLSLDDDVRKYIPELPDYGHRITVRMMLHQTSGFRDFLSLAVLSGHDPSDLDADDALQLIARQKGLNNVPGDEWIYSNTNYFLLGVVVQRATKKPLSQFAAENIFQPLGMQQTRFYDDHKVVVPNRVAAYSPGKGDQFDVNWSTFYELVGGGGLMSNVDDMLRWDQNFYANKLGKGFLLQTLQSQGTLNDGHKTTYAMGLFITNYRGLPVVAHGGALYGYRTEIMRFPEQHFSVICLCNLASANPDGRVRKIADLYLAGDFHDSAPKKNAAGFSDPARFAGTYLDTRKHFAYTFTAENRRLLAWGVPLDRISENKFYDLSEDVITFEPVNGTMHVSLVVGDELFFTGDRQDFHPPAGSLRSFVGQFHSAELDTDYSISWENGALSLKMKKQPLLHPEEIAPDTFNVGEYGLMVFRRDAHQQIAGFVFYEQSARGLEFTKVP